MVIKNHLEITSELHGSSDLLPVKNAAARWIQGWLD